MRKIAHVIGGGTISVIRPHLALCAPAYGGTAREIDALLAMYRTRTNHDYDVQLHLTKMANGGRNAPETTTQLDTLIGGLVANPETKMIFMTAAVCDFDVAWLSRIGTDTRSESPGSHLPRLRSDMAYTLDLLAAEKIVQKIRRERKDIFLIACKTTTGATPDEQFTAGLTLLKKSSCNLVLANDLHTKMNMIITPEQARYHQTENRKEVLEGLVEMALARSKLHFTRSKVVEGDWTIPWSSPQIPESLRIVVDYCRAKGAYKPFLGSTVGHFAVRAEAPGTFITSKRKTDFNKLDEVGMVLVEADGTDNVKAYGAKPSVGGQSQRIIFEKYPHFDCIVHFHCPKKPDSIVGVRSQKNYECGSHECGENTAYGLAMHHGDIAAVMLDKHGPNIVFNRNIDPQRVIRFIEENFDLSRSTSE